MDKICKFAKDSERICALLKADMPCNRNYKGRNKRMAEKIFYIESVSEGHPDKMADQISDCYFR